MTKESIPAVIYCRSARQGTSAQDLKAQETLCREFAQGMGYDVVHVFTDIIADEANEATGMDAILTFLRQSQQQHIVIIDEISRLASGLSSHLQVRAAIAAAGGILQSPSFEFDDTPNSILVENLLVCAAEHRKKMGEQI